jgi:hypothetical protein
MPVNMREYAPVNIREHALAHVPRRMYPAHKRMFTAEYRPANIQAAPNEDLTRLANDLTDRLRNYHALSR